jgi:hypothetical protein
MKMRCKIYQVDQNTGDETLINIRDSDEIAEDNSMTDAELIEMETEIRLVGRFWIGGGAAPLFCVTRAG